MKSVLIQCPKKFAEVVPIFTQHCLKHNIFDRIYIATDAAIPQMDRCVIIPLKKDMQFASNILHALKQIKEDIVLLCCEDHVMLDPHSPEAFQKCYDYMEKHPDVGRLRLTYNDKVKFADAPAKDGFRELHHKYAYLISLQPSLWRKDYLQQVLKPGEDAWQTEIQGSRRARGLTCKNSCVMTQVFTATNFYRAGKYLRHQFADYARENGIEIKNKMDVYDKPHDKRIVSLEEYNADKLQRKSE